MHDPSDEELSEVTAATKKAEHAYQEANAEFTEARAASRIAKERLAEERKKLLGIGEVLRETVDLELSEEQLEESSDDLESLLKPLEERVEALSELRQKAEQGEQDLNLSAEKLRVEIKGSEEIVRRDEERLNRELEKLETRRESLPEGYRPMSLEENLWAYPN